MTAASARRAVFSVWLRRLLGATAGALLLVLGIPASAFAAGTPAVAVTQTLSVDIYQCAGGSPTTTEVPGGAVIVTQDGSPVLSHANPIVADAVAAGPYDVTATAPSGTSFVGCGGQPANGSTEKKTVTVPTGGATKVAFYVAESAPNLAVVLLPETLSVVPGEVFDLKLQVSNFGGAPAINAIATDVLPSSLHLHAPLPTGCTSTGQEMSCALGTLAADSSQVVSIPVVVAPGICGPLTGMPSITVLCANFFVAATCGPPLVQVGSPVTCVAEGSGALPPSPQVTFATSSSGSFAGPDSCDLSGGSCRVTFVPTASGPLRVSFRLGSSTGSTNMVVVYAVLVSKGKATCTGYAAGTAQDVVVPTDASCYLLPGTTIRHDLRVQDGAQLQDTGALISHDLVADDPAGITVDGGSIGHDLSVTGLSGTPAGATMNHICGVTVRHDLRISDAESTAGPFLVGASPACTGRPSNRIGHDLVLSDNSGPLLVMNNAVGHDLVASRNTGVITLSDNIVGHSSRRVGALP